MRKLVAVSFLVLALAASLALLAGCGGGGGGGGSSLSEPEKVVDNALHEAINNQNFQPFLELIPPDMRDTYGQMLEQGFPYKDGNIVDIHYKTKQTDSTHVIVSYWGTIEYVDPESGEKKSESMTEEEASLLPLVKDGGNWYIDFSGATPETPQQ